MIVIVPAVPRTWKGLKTTVDVRETASLKLNEKWRRCSIYFQGWIGDDDVTARMNQFIIILGSEIGRRRRRMLHPDIWFNLRSDETVSVPKKSGGVEILTFKYVRGTVFPKVWSANQLRSAGNLWETIIIIVILKFRRTVSGSQYLTTTNKRSFYQFQLKTRRFVTMLSIVNRIPNFRNELRNARPFLRLIKASPLPFYVTGRTKTICCWRFMAREMYRVVGKIFPN